MAAAPGKTRSPSSSGTERKPGRCSTWWRRTGSATGSASRRPDLGTTSVRWHIGVAACPPPGAMMKLLLSVLAGLCIVTASPAQTPDHALGHARRFRPAGRGGPLHVPRSGASRSTRSRTGSPSRRRIQGVSLQRQDRELPGRRRAHGRGDGQIPIGNDPNQMTLTKDGRFAYVPIRGRQQDRRGAARSAPARQEPAIAHRSARRLHLGRRQAHLRRCAVR